jgi:hypothetical protein
MCLRNRYDVAGKTDRGGIDRQGSSPYCLVEAPEEGYLACCLGRTHFPPDQTGTASPRAEARVPCPMRRSSGRLNVVIHRSSRRVRIYPLTLISSNAPRARSAAFCASVRPRMPVILSRS